MKNIKVGFYLLLTLSLLLPFLVLPRILPVNKIECFTQYGRCNEELTKKFQSATNKNIRDAENDLKTILDSDKTIKKYAFSYKIPNLLRLDLILNKARFALKNDEMNSCALIDKEGMFLAYTPVTNLPVVRIKSSLPGIGESVDKKQLFALDLIYAINYFYQIKEGVLEEEYMQVLFPDEVRVLFPLDGERDAIMGGLKLILSRLNEQAEETKIVNAREIDLRYKNPIIR